MGLGLSITPGFHSHSITELSRGKGKRKKNENDYEKETVSRKDLPTEEDEKVIVWIALGVSIRAISQCVTYVALILGDVYE